jgi:hypothetical protein
MEVPGLARAVVLVAVGPDERRHGRRGRGAGDLLEFLTHFSREADSKGQNARGTE